MRLSNLLARFGREASAPTRPSRPTRPAILDRADDLVASGRPVRALDLLAAEHRTHPHPAIRARMVELRHLAATGFDGGPEREPWPPRFDDPFPDVTDVLPEVPAADLTAEVVSAAVAHHGALLVRGLYDAGRCAASVELIDRVTDARTRSSDDELADPDLYAPFVADATASAGLRKNRVGKRGGTWLADSPAAAARVMEDLHDVGAVGVVTGHFGQRPVFSLQKSTLRRAQPEYNLSGWHQDGSFLGEGTRAMNVWVALTDCGGHRPTPGLQVVPRRIEEILPLDGGLGSVSIADATVAAAARGTAPIEPSFAAGDALFFDGHFVHRTHLVPDMTEPRYAIECWFFSPNHASQKYVSFLA
jgi:hypothetical protein